jgi:hypothetical protein
MRVERTDRRRHTRSDRVAKRVKLLAPEQQDPRTRRMLALDQQPKISAAPSIPIQPSKDIDARIMEVLHTILEMKKAGVTPALVFDVDNTLVDTRYRTMAAARAFVLNGERPLAHATLETVGYLPSETCANNRIDDPDVQRAFADFFDDYFWRESSFTHDQPIEMTIALAQLAEKLGAEIYFLTGRTETFRDLTKDKLEELGLTVKSKEHLIMKSPERDAEGNLEKTEPFKARELRRLDRRKVKVAGYVTEGSRDLRYL